MHKFVFLVSLTVIPALAQAQTADLHTQAGCGSTKTQFDVKVDKSDHSVEKPLPGKAQVFVIEEINAKPGELMIGHATTRVGVDGTWMGANHEWSYLSFSLDPGDHRLCTDVQSSLISAEKMSAAANLMVEEGKTYYYRVYVDNGEDKHGPPHVSLKLVDEAEGFLLVGKSGKSTSKLKK